MKPAISDEVITEKLQRAFNVPVFVGFAPEDELKRLKTYNYFILRPASITGQNAGRYTQNITITRVYEGVEDLQEIEIINALSEINLREHENVVQYNILRKGETDNYCDVLTFSFARGLRSGRC